MAKRTRKQRRGWWEDLGAALRSDILNAIDSAKGESPNSIFDRFDLAGRDVNRRTFQRFVHDRRDKVDPVPEDPSAEVPSWPELDQMMRLAIADNVRAGNVKTYEAATVISKCFDHQRLGIEKAAEGRAQGKFEAWQAEYNEQQRKRVAEGEGKLKKQGFNAETIRQIRAIYGLGDVDDGQ